MTRNELGHLGALARMKMYGNPGTPEGRSKGGVNSVIKNKKLFNNFKIAKKHKKPADCGLMAEFMGILFGDGHLGKYQILITTNSETDAGHAIYTKNLIKKLFNLNGKISFKKNKKAVNIVVSSVNLAKWLSEKGMPVGNKLDKGLHIPAWIKKNRTYEKSFIRGLFDTDGCIYVDTHKKNGRIYKNQGWSLTSYSYDLRTDIFNTLRRLDFSPTLRRSQKSVYMRKKYDIIKYFKEIGTSNPKHLERYKNGRVPKWS